MKYKWILAILFWFFGGPIGSIIGFFLGAWFDSRKTYKSSSRGRFVYAFTMLSAAVMKADQRIKRSELDYVKSFLLANFGKEDTIHALKLLKEMLNKDLKVDEVCYQIKLSMTESSKLQLIHYLYGIANADRNIDQREIIVIEEISMKIGLSRTEHNSVKNMFIVQNDSAYEILGIHKSATNEEVKKAFRAMAVKHHPDKVSQLGENVQNAAKLKFQKINDAYYQIKKERGFI
jgi:DnaJ like chaperone protein